MGGAESVMNANPTPGQPVEAAPSQSIEELETRAKATQLEWERQQLRANRNSAAYKTAHKAAREASRNLLEAKLARR